MWFWSARWWSALLFQIDIFIDARKTRGGAVNGAWLGPNFGLVSLSNVP